jgi:general secretion pathway protein L
VLLVKAGKFSLVSNDGEDNGECSLAEIVQVLIQRKIDAVTIRFTEKQHFSGQLSARALPLSRAEQMARIDLAENYPFLTEGTSLLFSKEGPGAPTTYHVVKDGILFPLIDVLRQNKIEIAAMEIASNGDLLTVDAMSMQKIIKPAPKFSLSKLTVYLSAAAVIAFILTLGNIYLRNEEALSRLTEIVSDRQAQAVAIRKRMTVDDEKIKLQQLARSGKTSVVPVSVLWEELAAALPDTTWLTDMMISSDAITLSGYSTAAAELIPLLNNSQSWSEPVFVSQVTRVPGQDGERFSIRMKVNADD